MEITSIVLAGGKSLRLGRNKALETFCGKSLIECVIERLRPISTQVLVVTSHEQSDLPISRDVEILIDIYPDKGPLAGIYTGLLTSKSSSNIVVACDMPFLNVELLGYMVELSSDFDAVVPRLEGGILQPLHAIYTRNCLSKMETQLEQNQLQLNSFLNMIRVRYVEEVECRRLDLELLSFFNINEQSDLDQAITLAQEGKC